jgi:hypothetical protein
MEGVMEGVMDTIIFMRVALIVFAVLVIWQMYDFKQQNKGE